MENLKVKKHKERPDLTGEHPWGDAGQLIFLCIFIIVWVADIFFLKMDESEFLEFPIWVRIPVGVIILICSLLLSRRSMKMVFGTKRDKPEIIHNSIYNRVRHPMYLGALLFYACIIILSYSLPLFIVFIPVFLFYNYIAKHEEKLLINKFGSSYIDYMKKVKRWIPCLKASS